MHTTSQNPTHKSRDLGILPIGSAASSRRRSILKSWGIVINRPQNTDSSQPPTPAVPRRRKPVRIERDDISQVVERARRAATINLGEAGAPIAVCSGNGELLALSPPAVTLFERAALPTSPLPLQLPESLWIACEAAGMGGAADWRPAYPTGMCIGFTPYELSEGRVLLLMREISRKQDELSARLHQQRLELTGRLVAMIAHDLRVPLSTIVFNAEMARDRNLRGRELALVLRDVRSSASRMRASIDGLLDFARPGGSRCMPVDLDAALQRLRSLLHPSLRDGEHGLRFQVESSATWVHTNALLLEQVLVNLVMNAVEAASSPVGIVIRASLYPARRAPTEARALRTDPLVRLTVQDSGPGIPPEHRERIFEPFFTTKQQGTGLGLPMAREAMGSIGAALTLEPSTHGARFALWFSPAAAPTETSP